MEKLSPVPLNRVLEGIEIVYCLGKGLILFRLLLTVMVGCERSIGHQRSKRRKGFELPRTSRQASCHCLFYGHIPVSAYFVVDLCW
jgi:hypothetical protein